MDHTAQTELNKISLTYSKIFLRNIVHQPTNPTAYKDVAFARNLKFL
jgi:hypothetical protein